MRVESIRREKVRNRLASVDPELVRVLGSLPNAPMHTRIPRSLKRASLVGYVKERIPAGTSISEAADCEADAEHCAVERGRPVDGENLDFGQRIVAGGVPSAGTPRTTGALTDCPQIDIAAADVLTLHIFRGIEILVIRANLRLGTRMLSDPVSSSNLCGAPPRATARTCANRLTGWIRCEDDKANQPTCPARWPPLSRHRGTQPPHTGNTWPTKQFAASLHRYAANSASSRGPTRRPSGTSRFSLS